MTAKTDFAKRDTAIGRFFAQSVGERIRVRREAAGLLAIDLARQAGVSRSYLSELESNQKAKPSADVLYEIADVLGTTIPDLLGRPEQRPDRRKRTGT